MNNKPSKKMYNLCRLEDELIIRYSEFILENNNETRTNLFLSIKELTFSMLSISRDELYYANREKFSYEYACYLFERIVMGNWRPIAKYNNRFPWQKYITLNLKCVVYDLSKKPIWEDLISDLEFVIDKTFEEYVINEEDKAVENKIFKNDLSKLLFKALKIFYSNSEIQRLYPISINMLESSMEKYGKWINDTMPLDVKDFLIVLITLSKRVIEEHNVNLLRFNVKNLTLKKAITNSVRSSIFLSSIVNTKYFPRELLLSLDINSLYRLLSVMGGKTITLPTLATLDTLLGATVAASKTLIEGKEPKISGEESKKDYDLVFSSHINFDSFTSKLMSTFDIFKNDSYSEPLINSLLMASKSLELLLTNSKDFLENASLDSITKNYKELSDIMNNLSGSLINISHIMKEKINDQQ